MKPHFLSKKMLQMSKEYKHINTKNEIKSHLRRESDSRIRTDNGMKAAIR